MNLESDIHDLPPYLQGLNTPQLKAATTTEGPLIVLAGAGSGKTKMLTARVAHLIEGHRVAPHQILAVTFTNKAADEMYQRVDRMRQMTGGGGLGRPEIGTFHSVCVRMLRAEAPATPFTKPFVIYDDSDQLTLIKAVLKKMNIDPKQLSPKTVQSQINLAKCHAHEPEDMQLSPYNPLARKMREIYAQYQKDLYANNAIDFGEILTMAYRVLRDHPEIRAKYQRRWRYVHVDEYQDTNRAQYLFLSMLTKPEHGGHQNLCVVGDEDQSIYKWRGADITNILDFEKDYPHAVVVKLEQNYRSTQRIITAASEVISHNTQRKNKKLWTQNPEGGNIVRIQAPDERTEAEAVIAEMKKLAADDNRGFDDFAIFYRTHAQSRQFEDVLRREKINYQIVGGLRFYDRKEIKDIMGYLRLVLNPSDTVSLLRVINTPARGIGKTTVEKIEEITPADKTVWDTLKGLTELRLTGGPSEAAEVPAAFAGKTLKKLIDFVFLIERLQREQPRLKMSELYHMILDETGYVRELKAEATVEAESRIENLEEFDTILQEFDEENEDFPRDALLPAFLEQSSLVSETDQSFQLHSLKMMTYHGSKGLEFPVVFMVGMEDGLFPSVRPWEQTDPEEIEEERRLCYVGMTRAREKLYMCNAVMRRLWGQVEYNEPSRFFQEFSPDHVTMRDLTRGYFSGSQHSGYGSAESYHDRRHERSAQRNRGYVNEGRSHDYDDETSARPMPSRSVPLTGMPKPASDSPVGLIVAHPDYGRGKVLSVEGADPDHKVIVEFAGEFGGTVKRKFMFRFIQGFVERR